MKILNFILLITLISCGKKEKESSPNFIDTNKDLISDEEVKFYNLEENKFLMLLEPQVSGSFEVKAKKGAREKTQSIPLGQNINYFKSALQNQFIATVIKDDQKEEKILSKFLRNPFLKVITCLNKGDIASLSEITPSLDSLQINFNQSMYVSSLIPNSELINLDYELTLMNPNELKEFKVLNSRSLTISQTQKSFNLQDSQSFLNSPFCLILNIKNFNLKTPLRIISYNSNLDNVLTPNSFTNLDPYKRSTAMMNLAPLNNRDLFQRENQLIEFSNTSHNLQISFNDLYDSLSNKDEKSMTEVTTIEEMQMRTGEKIKIKGHFYKKAVLPQLVSGFQVDCPHRDAIATGHCSCLVTKSYQEVQKAIPVSQDEIIKMGNHDAHFSSNSYREFEFYNSYFDQEKTLKFDFQKKSTIELEESVTYQMQGALRNKCPANKVHRVFLPAKYYFTGKIIKSSL